MAEVDTLGILQEIQALVSDKLQVVSYKWLSRNFLLSSNASKRVLQEFVEKHGNELEVVYALSGWLKNNPSIYHVKLVTGNKLAETKEEFDGRCSVQVYSVQPCIPKDPATLWNAEFVQAEELFRQPPTIDNCLWDNRFCGISNSFVTRNSKGITVSMAALQPKQAGLAGPSKSNSMNQNATIAPTQQKKVHESSPKVRIESSNVKKDIKTESTVLGGHEQVSKPSSNKENVPLLPANKKKGQNDQKTSGNGGSLANMWGRATAKSKPTVAAVENVSAEAQICAREAVEATSSDEDSEDVNFKRPSNGEGTRKRRVVFDFSDEEDEYKDAVNLASPEPSKNRSFLDEKINKSSAPEKNNSNDNEQKDDKPHVKLEKKSEQMSKEDYSVVSKGKTGVISSSDKAHNTIPEDNTIAKHKVADAGSTSPKRRKVLKTRIDERGREVTEVVWEGEETEAKPDGSTTKKTDNDSVNNAVNRAPAAKKSPTPGSTAPSNIGGKAGNKKSGNSKDPKQGNILSFFKRV